MKRMIYLDHAATTAVRPEVLKAMIPYFGEKYGNPSSIYDFASISKTAIRSARSAVASLIGADERDIYFTGGGSEADNWAIKCAAEAYSHRGHHIITSKIEHHAVLHTCQYLERCGYSVTYLTPDESGIISPRALRTAIRPDTILVSIMTANNEIGTIEPIRELGQICRERGILFHTDAVQALGQIPMHAEKMNIDLLSASAHKLQGPKGVGCLYIRPGISIGPLIHGGGQERHRRAGTENVPGIVGFGKAAQLALAEMNTRAKKERELRDYLIRSVLSQIPYSRLNGSPSSRLPGNVNFSFQFVEGESLLIMLDMEGICASSGSACTSGSVDPSHVLLAIGLPEEIARGSIRFTIGEENTREEMDYVVQKLVSIVSRLREMSPAYEVFSSKRP